MADNLVDPFDRMPDARRPTPAPPIQTPTDPARRSRQPQLVDPFDDAGGAFTDSLAPMPPGFGASDDFRPAEFDFPSIDRLQAPSLEARLKITGGLATTFDGEARANIVKAQIPGTTSDRDRNGNVFVTVPGQGSFYFNPPGPDRQDVFDATMLIGQGVLAGRTGAGGAVRMGATGTLGRAVGVAGAEGALSIGQDAIAQQLGSGQGISLGRAGLAAGIGGLAEVLGPRIVDFVASRVGNRLTVPVNGRPVLTDAGEQALRDAGFEPSTLTPDFLEEFQRAINRRVTPGEAARFADARTLPTPVPLTRGDITRTPGDQMFESQTAKDVFGEPAGRQIRDVRATQDDALRRNLEQLQEGVAGGTPRVTAQGGGGPLVSEAVNTLRNAANEVVRDAYRVAGEAGQAGLSGPGTQQLSFALGNAVADRIRFAPRAQAKLEELSTLAGEVGEGHVLVKSLMDWRREVSQLARETADATDGSALGQLVRSFDDQIKSIVDRGIIEGNPEAVDLWLNAIESRREFAEVFQGRDPRSANYLIDRLTQTVQDGSRRILAVDPEVATKAIFTSSRLSSVQRGQLSRQLTRLRQVLVSGGRRDAWNAIREEAMLRLAGRAEGAFEASTAQRAFSGANFAREVDTAFRNNPEVMRALFTESEISLMQQIKRTGLAATTVTRGGANTSNTSGAIGQLFSKVLGPNVSAAFARSDFTLTKMFNQVRAGRAAPPVGFVPPGQSFLPPGTVGGAAAGGAQLQEDSR